jgi:WD40 repeat protein
VQGIRISLTFLALIASIARALAEEPPLQQPQLRIETGMHTAIIRRFDISADGRLLATGSEDKTIRLWSWPDGRLLRVFRVPIGPRDDGKIFAVALSPDGRILAAGGWDAAPVKNDGLINYVYLFDTVSGAIIGRLGPLPNVMYDLAFSPDGRRLAVGLWGPNGVRMWAAPFTGAPYADKDYEQTVYGLSFDRSGRLATASWDGGIRLYDDKLNLLNETDAAPEGSLPYDIAFSPDGTECAVVPVAAFKRILASGR